MKNHLPFSFKNVHIWPGQFFYNLLEIKGNINWKNYMNDGYQRRSFSSKYVYFAQELSERAHNNYLFKNSYLYLSP